jgi:dienelactone hydrolase
MMFSPSLSPDRSETFVAGEAGALRIGQDVPVPQPQTPPPIYLQPFVLDVPERTPERNGTLDFYRPSASGRRAAILFVHGGPGPKDLKARPRDWPVFRGYAAAVADRGFVGVTVDHSLIRGVDRIGQAAAEVVAAADLVRADPQVDPDRLALWFFSGAGLLIGDWLKRRPSWLRAIAATYPWLSVPGVDRTSAIEQASRGLKVPFLLTRVGLEREQPAAQVDKFVAAAAEGGGVLEVIDVPEGHHGFDMMDYTTESRSAVRTALDWTTARLAPATPAPVGSKHPAPVEVVSRQLEAYNRHDLEQFLATYAPNAVMHSRDGRTLTGRRALREVYGPRLAAGKCRAEIVNRIAEGGWVVDHEIAHGIEPEPIRVLAAYRVLDGLIAEVRFFA